MENFAYILYYIIIPFVIIVFLGMLYLIRPRTNRKSKREKQYEEDIKEMSDFPLL